MLLNGCATNRYSTTPYYQQTDSYNKPQELSHIVQSGETLSIIGKIYGVDYKDIATWNQLAPPYTIYPGQSLRIYPSSSGSGTVSYDDSGIPVSTSPPSQGRQLGKSSTYKTGGYKKSTQAGKTTRSGGTYYTVKRGETLYSIAKRYGQDYRTVAKWNNLAPPYTLRAGQRLRVAATTTQTKQISQRYSPSSSPSLPTPSSSLPTSSPQSKVVSHVVQAGDTISSVAQQYGYGVEKIAYWNGLSPPYDLPVGRRLRVAPLPTRKASASRTTGSYSNSRKTSYSSATTTSPSYHQVAAGDTLYSIARTYSAGVADIAIWNNLQPPYTLSPGQTLQVAPSNSKNQTRPSLNSSVHHNTGYHTVVSSDTLYSIAKLYNYNASEIANWNRLRYPYHLQVGQSLRVYPPSGVLDRVHYKVPLNTSSTSKQASHTVGQGETLYSISRRYGYHVNQLAAWNGLVPPYSLVVGQRLRISP
ncbi:putative glycosyl hydrolase [Thioploca ingrica]|uniref:Putative glycosyl hydrolase n=1 Tax=Thioploca ingrica TaxID=40754 RepID=A0A090ANI4_9GAMM|nr:putative glycosyl hydrolase [Thioploca ingrica]